ncbi:hypothetical protein [Rubripirellula reticaptiva]|uniref:Uncharacterized protein n=1 Tax=Rubripirellula reticaptiva TaxID=2528013 RepID=A0A5C6F5D4_9BACT|nr:hypothetical protein [Rubripirellula reticaptiva]TWU55734.1 hypothetical protein Poly59_20350 [Rubripirellula reticaptiva]
MTRLFPIDFKPECRLLLASICGLVWLGAGLGSGVADGQSPILDDSMDLRSPMDDGELSLREMLERGPETDGKNDKERRESRSDDDVNAISTADLLKSKYTENDGGSGLDESGKESAGEDSEDTDDLPSRSKTDPLSRLRKPLSSIRLSSNDRSARVPEDLAAASFDRAEQAGVYVTGTGLGVPRPNRYTECFQHRPLYFEQANLERCGQSYGVFQNAISGFRFLSNTMMLPYHMTKQRPDCPVARGGDCQTCQSYSIDWNPFPLDSRAALAEMAAIGGFSLLLL